MPGESQARRGGQVDGLAEVHQMRASTKHARVRSNLLYEYALMRGVRGRLHARIAYLYTPPRPQWPLSPSMVYHLVLSIPIWVGDAHRIRVCVLDTLLLC